MRSEGAFSKRFATTWSDNDLRSRIAVKAHPVKGLADVGPTEAANRLDAHLRKIVVPTAQTIAVLRQLIEYAKTYCDMAYPNSAAVRSLIYASSPPITPHSAPTICLTGLAGVGKSVLFDAFCRVFGKPDLFDIPGHVRLKLNACWRMTIRGRAGFSHLVQPHFRDQSAISPARILGCTASEAAAQGIALIFADEFQFITSGSANTMMANLLFRLAQIGPPVIYACNFSMIHALWRRPQQDRDRLLLNPIILCPDRIGPDWAATVNDHLDAAEEFSTLKNEGNIRLLHDYTYGIKRCLRSLLVIAYMYMRKQNQTYVTASHLSNAYQSFEYGAMRNDVENLFQGVVTPSLLRKDLTCPFRDAIASETSRGEVRHLSTVNHAASATNAALLSMLSPDTKPLVAAASTPESPLMQTQKKLSRRPPATADNLLGGAIRFSSKDKIEK